ncbi:hypothetical protein Aph01nite_09280 [Acrocarpospora phusangensis]|uniref:Uncharacterized protein n=1 Tax=Acrocarpospora phusangensis TaxID=1070424 RepID=A0A919Q825_9ACTN|nr:DUF6223 family protein [Acrocarpospora phusangensis]GIH22618.1 hypothetical protein Aph01nite_09280 [Acrocarpospora phusangensis]
MSVRHLLEAHVIAQPSDVTAYALTAGRLWSMVAGLLGLAGAAVGGLTLARPNGRIGRSGRGGAVALLAGLAGVVIGGVVVAVADGGPGSGSGIVGGVLALVVGLVAMILGWRARSSVGSA